MMILTFLFVLLGPLAVLGIWLWMRSRREPVALIERFDIGRVLGRTFSIFSREGLPIAGLAALLLGIPNAIWMAWFRSAMAAAALGVAPGAAPGRAFASLFTGAALALFGGLLISGTIFYIAAIRLRIRDGQGDPGTLGEALAAVPGLFLPTLAVAVLSYAGVIALLVLFIVPGVVMALSWFVVLPVMIEERPGIVEAFRRSRALALGSRGRLLVVSLLVLVLGMLLSVVSNLLMRGMMGGGSVLLLGIAQVLLTTLSGMIHAGFFAGVYLELKQIREGATIPSLAEVFA